MYPRFSPDYRPSDILAPVEIADLEFEIFGYLKRKSGLDHHFLYKYGRSGLYALLCALELEGKKVIIPSYSCVVVAHAIVKSGNTPVFLDSSEDSFQPASEAYLEAIDNETAMIIPTHLFGYPEETAELYREVKARFPEVIVVQDCAHSYFCKDSTGKVVTHYGDVAIYGANISKLVNGIHAGILSIRDKAIADKVTLFNRKFLKANFDGLYEYLYSVAGQIAFNPGIYSLVDYLINNTSSLDSETQYFAEDRIDLPRDYDHHLSRTSKSILKSSLERFDERVENRRKIAKKYFDLMKPLDDNTWFRQLSYVDGATWSHYPVLVREKERDVTRLELREIFKSEVGIIVDYSISDLSAYKSMGYNSCPIAHDYSKRVLNLPLTFFENRFFDFDLEEEMSRISEKLIDVMNGASS